MRQPAGRQPIRNKNSLHSRHRESTLVGPACGLVPGKREKMVVKAGWPSWPHTSFPFERQLGPSFLKSAYEARNFPSMRMPRLRVWLGSYRLQLNRFSVDTISYERNFQVSLADISCPVTDELAYYPIPSPLAPRRPAIHAINYTPMNRNLGKSYTALASASRGRNWFPRLSL